MPFDVFIFQPKNTLKTVLFESNNLTSAKIQKLIWIIVSNLYLNTKNYGAPVTHRWHIKLHLYPFVYKGVTEAQYKKRIYILIKKYNPPPYIFFSSKTLPK